MQLEGFHPKQIAEKVYDSQHLVVGQVWSIDHTVCRDVYFEPVAVIMTEELFYTCMKHPDSRDYINFYDTTDTWTFMGFEMAVVKSKGKSNKNWMEVV